MLLKYFIVVDNDLLDLYWIKYSKMENRWKNYNYNSLHQEFKSLDWYVYKYCFQKENITIPKDILSQPIEYIKYDE